ncbi:MAG: putative sulfate exporter family transporter, partial [Acidobacteriota bacterium]|nr:putative sulfate exporter family transporter [Acidobacteriota bacterium]
MFAALFSPPFALAIGIVCGLLFTHPFEKAARAWARMLLQVSVVALGFGTNLREVLSAGRASLPYTAIGISLTILLGLALGRACKVRPKT